jgi:hypothetical protein
MTAPELAPATSSPHHHHAGSKLVVYGLLRLIRDEWFG